MYVIYADGTCMDNPGAGAWAAIVAGPGGAETLTGTEADTTSNRMELQAVIGGLDHVPEGAAVTVVSDSRYVVAGATKWLPERWKRNGWTGARGGDVANADLWKRIDALASARKVEWRWVRARSGDPGNAAAHRAARAALRRVTG